MEHSSDIEIMQTARQLAATVELVRRCTPALLDVFARGSNGFPTGGDSSSADGITGTSTERAALSPDLARSKRQHFAELLAKLEVDSRELSNIARVWLIGVTVTATDEAAPSNDIWCDNHIRFGMKEPRRERCNYCRWCLQIESDRGRYPTKELCELRARRGRIYDHDLERLMPIVVEIKRRKIKRRKAA